MTHLPRLLYIGDVPVESSTGGSLLLYRLLSDYPSDKLRIAELNPWTSDPDRRLDAVRYESVPFGIDRLIRSRLGPWYSAYLHEKAPWTSRTLGQKLDGFEAEAVLSVTHWYAYRTAAAYAQQADLPLYLIAHDDMRRLHPIWEPLRFRLDETMGRAYRQANRRFCVSPYMAEAYEEEWGVEGDVLYPHRGPDVHTYQNPPDKRRSRDRLTVGYAGSFGVEGGRILASVANQLESDPVQFLVFSPLSAEDAARHGVDHPSIEYRSLIPAHEVVPTLRKEADTLLALMRFQLRSKSIAQYSFPSKLTDYTATGLPIVLWGPDYWSAIRWAHDYDVAETVTEHNPSAVADAFRSLVNDDEKRQNLGRRALKAGEYFFSHARAVETFREGLTSSDCSPNPVT